MILAALLFLQFATNSSLGYRFRLPDGFIAFPAGKSQPDVVDCWTELMPPSSGGALILCVQRMRGTLGRERLARKDLPAQIQLTTFTWKGLEIDGLRTDTVQAGMPVVIYAAQVPLKPEAIQLIVAGPSSQQPRAEAILTSILASLEGETNWLTSAERAGRFGTIVGWALGIAIAFVIIRLVLTRRRAQTT